MILSMDPLKDMPIDFINFYFLYNTFLGSIFISDIIKIAILMSMTIKAKK